MSITTIRALVYREVCARELHKEPMSNEISEELKPNEINVKFESPNVTSSQNIRASPPPRKRTEPISEFEHASKREYSRSEKRKESDEHVTLLNLSDQSDLGLGDFIYEEHPCEKNFQSPKRVKTSHVQLSSKDSNTDPFSHKTPPDPEKQIENPFFTAFDKLHSSIAPGVMDSSLSVSPSILSLLEDDTEAW